MFEFDLTDELRFVIKKLVKKDKKRVEILNKKIKEVINNDSDSIDRYSNCLYDLKEFKHLHIDKSFVLLFKVDKKKNFILFARLGHHDDFFK
ncbi:addiction module toxin RelE [Candidatus Woesearchaeota archaeon]|nr:MAG: addiction module toxin RelE [Candidatus Woesearchaeota archaeon]